MAKMSTKKWRNCITAVLNNERNIRCPFCEKTDVDYGFKRIRNQMGYGSIWCNSCGRGIMLDRIEFSENTDMGNKIPNDIKY